ncbi:hypothetical protein HRM2_26000 [Desulforapulum autotrophicum HRM2]|uniref:Uncharacterized protein n=1 Tax=Desulforapulum autotrophicum (strain ATCC 43914 / DSM 3382 / VKM B-1955 / HRM2) TaxID=177437 RepID=C0QH45_DESAH|nr:hypothetical protein [Desulforapulum autotrophicum]ACN15694.1 hypothetical protein HRM2_26000 [Desulforapulum autotrophicum HRM2]
MLNNTFHSIPDCGAETEFGLWKNAINSWTDINNNNISGISAEHLSTLKHNVDISIVTDDEHGPSRVPPLGCPGFHKLVGFYILSTYEWKMCLLFQRKIIPPKR